MHHARAHGTQRVDMCTAGAKTSRKLMDPRVSRYCQRCAATDLRVDLECATARTDKR